MSSKNAAKWPTVLERRRDRAFSDRTVRWLGDGAKGRGDEGISAGQLECLVAGRRLIEQGDDDHGDVGARDRAGRYGRGGEPDRR